MANRSSPACPIRLEQQDTIIDVDVGGRQVGEVDIAKSTPSPREDPGKGLASPQLPLGCVNNLATGDDDQAGLVAQCDVQGLAHFPHADQLDEVLEADIAKDSEGAVFVDVVSGHGGAVRVEGGRGATVQGIWLFLYPTTVTVG